jgi:hypothetical protein
MAGEPPVWKRAIDDGKAARRAGEPRDPTPYLDRYGDWSGAQTPSGFWLSGWDTEDELIAVEESRPKYGEVEWSPVRRKREAR